MPLTNEELRELTQLMVTPLYKGKSFTDDTFVFTIDTRRWTYSTAPYDDNAFYQFRARMDGTVDWGDGVSEDVRVTTGGGGWVPHTYDTPGMYQIKVTGDVGLIRLGYEESYPQMWWTRTWANCLISVDTALPSTISGMYSHTCGLFTHCAHLVTVPKNYLSKNNPDRTDVSYMFADCVSLRSISGDFFKSDENTTDYAYCFYRTGLRQIPAGLFDYSPMAVNFRYCFALSDFLATVPEDLFENISQNADFSYCFSGCLAITSNVPRLWETHPNAPHTGCFNMCINAANYADIPSDWR